MKVSVALCTYNGTPYLDEQLNSIAVQTRPPDELIACDDGSTDETLSRLESFAKRAPFPVRVLRNTSTLGTAKNFERAIRLCKGDSIALCDQDDVWRPEKLERLSEVLETSPEVGLVFSDAELVNAAGHALGRRLWQSIRFSASEQADVNQGRALRVLLKHRVVTGATMMFRGVYREQVLPISDLCLHDAWIAFVVAVFAELRGLPESLTAYRQHTANQVGAVISYAGAVQEAGSRGRASYMCNYSQYAALREHIKTLYGVPNKAYVLAGLDAKMAHVQARMQLPDNRFRRVLPVVQELVWGRYHRYSSGWQSAVKDMVMLG